MNAIARRLGPADRDLAIAVFAEIAGIFGEPWEPTGAAWAETLLARPDFWVIAALRGEVVLGGLTAHALPMTRAEATELFVYDVAVRADHRRQGIGRLLMTTLRDAAADAGIGDVFVAADDEPDAVAFYRALGAAGDAVTMFVFPAPSR